MRIFGIADLKLTANYASQTLNFVRRNFSTCPLTPHPWTLCPQLEYASSVWDNSIQCNVNKLESVQRRAARFVCHMTTDRHPASHPCYRDSLGTTTACSQKSGCFTAYAMVWSQYHLIISSRPQLLPEHTKPATFKSDATPVCTARRTCSQAQSYYGTVYLQIPATCYLAPDSFKLELSKINLIWSRTKFLSHRTAWSYFLKLTI